MNRRILDISRDLPDTSDSADPLVLVPVTVNASLVTCTGNASVETESIILSTTVPHQRQPVYVHVFYKQVEVIE